MGSPTNTDKKRAIEAENLCNGEPTERGRSKAFTHQAHRLSCLNAPKDRCLLWHRYRKGEARNNQEAVSGQAA